MDEAESKDATPEADPRHGRQAYERRDWTRCFEILSRCDRDNTLDAEDLERLAITAYLTGRDELSVDAFSRAYRANVDSNRPAAAARCAFWLSLILLLRGEGGAATAWLSRGEQQITDIDCVERGYLLLPPIEIELSQGDASAAFQAAVRALEWGEKHGDADLISIAQHLMGRARIQQWRVREGLALLDQAMLAATTDELTPMVAGLVYCSVIEVCQSAFALERAREWTSALAQWCEDQPDLVAFTATCLVHRAEVLRLSGDWPLAMTEATQALQRPSPPAQAFYQQGEIHRLRGEFKEAEAAFLRASEAGCEPQPGLSLLRLSQGRTKAAEASLQRTVDATTDRAERARLLPALIETLLARRNTEGARQASEELEQIATEMSTETMRAMALQAKGAVELASGSAAAAIATLRQSARIWTRVGVPYEAGRCRAVIASACGTLGDEEGALLEFEGAAALFRQLGASVELDRLERLRASADTSSHGLSNRELQVLRLLAGGLTNKAIATQLNLSQRTVDRHVSNVFDKLDVSTRAAATAFAFENDLV